MESGNYDLVIIKDNNLTEDLPVLDYETVQNFMEELECESEDANLDLTDTSSPASSDSTSDVESQSCPVCNGMLTGKKNHLYYGARVCLSCRGFFLRSVQSQQYILFKCLSGGEKCQDDKSGKIRCRCCRFERCLSVGMKKDLVMSDEKRKSLIAKRNFRELSKPKSPANNSHFSHGVNPCEQQQLDEAFVEYMEHWFAKYFSLFAAKQDFMANFVPVVMSPVAASNVERRFAAQLEAADKHALVEYGFSTPEIRSLPAYDRMHLMRANLDVTCGLLCVVVFCSGMDMYTYFQELLEYGRRKSLEDKEICGIVRDMEKLSLHYSGPDANHKMHDIAKLWSGHVSQEDMQEVLGLISRFTHLIRKKDETIDSSVFMLVMKLLFLSHIPDVKLEDPDKVEQLRQTQSWLLYRYLKANYPSEANVRFHKILMLNEYFAKIYNMLRF